MDRLSELRGLYSEAKSAVDDSPAYSRAPLIKEARAILAEIAELEAEAPDDKTVTALDEVLQMRQKRAS